MVVHRILNTGREHPSKQTLWEGATASRHSCAHVDHHHGRDVLREGFPSLVPSAEERPHDKERSASGAREHEIKGKEDFSDSASEYFRSAWFAPAIPHKPAGEQS
jgi:hypothetical protein